MPWGRRASQTRTRSPTTPPPNRSLPAIWHYVDAALEHLRDTHPELDPRVDRESQTLTLDAPADLQARFRQAPPEIRPDTWRFVLTADREAMEDQIAESRRHESNWPQVHYLWRLNPVVQWLNDRMLASFGRHEAPVLAGVPGLLQGAAVFVVAGTGRQPSRTAAGVGVDRDPFPGDRTRLTWSRLQDLQSA